MIADSGQIDRNLLDRLDHPIKWYIKDRIYYLRKALMSVYPTIVILAAVWLGTLIGYDRATKHYEYPLDAVLEMEPYESMILRGTYEDFLSMYRPYPAQGDK